jgi:hypothetical protein
LGPLLATIRALNEAKIKTKGDLVIVFTVEEETTFKGVKAYIDQNKGKIPQSNHAHTIERSLNDKSKRVSLASLNNVTEFFIRGGFPSMPEVGDMAPDFELKSHLEKDKKVKLSDFRGKKNVVIAFYPLAWTPV